MDISKVIMYIIAGMIGACSLLVIALHGVSGMPHGYLGLGVAILFMLISVGITRVPSH